MKHDLRTVIHARILEVETEWSYYHSQKKSIESKGSTSYQDFRRYESIQKMISESERALNELNNLLQVCEDK